MPENLDTVVEEGNKIDYVELKDMEKERKKKQLKDKYNSIKEGIGKAYSKGKEVLGKTAKSTVEAYKKTRDVVEKVRDKGAKFEAWRSKTFTPSKRYIATKRQSLKTYKSSFKQKKQRYVPQQTLYSENILSGLSPSGSDDNIFGSFNQRPSKQKKSDDFGMGNIFGSTKTHKNKKSNNIFDML
jgi:hypothetical protein